MHGPETFVWGFLGSAAVEIVTLLGYYSAPSGRLPARYRRFGFWVTRTVLACLAGTLAVAYAIDQRILAFNVGAATPLIVSFMAKGVRRLPAGTETPTRPGDAPTGRPPEVGGRTDRHDADASRSGRPSGSRRAV